MNVGPFPNLRITFGGRDHERGAFHLGPVSWIGYVGGAANWSEKYTMGGPSLLETLAAQGIYPGQSAGALADEGDGGFITYRALGSPDEVEYCAADDRKGLYEGVSKHNKFAEEQLKVCHEFEVREEGKATNQRWQEAGSEVGYHP